MKKATLGDALSNPDLLQMFAAAIAQGMRQAQIDPEKEAKKARWRERLRKERADAEANRIQRESDCPHMREDNTSVIAWFRFNDGVTRGVCQRCDKRFNPYLEDGRTPDPDYARMIKIPTKSLR